MAKKKQPVEETPVEETPVEETPVEEKGENYRTTRPIWSRSGNVIPALTKVTQKDVSASIQELISVGHVEIFDPNKK